MSSNVECTRASMKSFIRAIRANVISTIRLVIQWRYAKITSSFPYTWCDYLLFESRFVDPILEIFIRDKASLSEKTSPELNTNNPKDEEDKEAEQQDITKHGKSVQQQHHKNSECKVLDSEENRLLSTSCLEFCWLLSEVSTLWLFLLLTSEASPHPSDTPEHYYHIV